MDKFATVIMAFCLLVIISFIIALPISIYSEMSAEIDSHSYDHVKIYVDSGYPDIENDMLDGKISEYELTKMRTWSKNNDHLAEMKRRAEKRAKLLKAEKN